MAHLTTRTELLQALGSLHGYLEDLRRARFDEGSTKLRLVINASQRDATLRALSEQLLTRMPREELERCLEREGFDPPLAVVPRMAFGYALLSQLKKGERLEARALLSREAFRGAGLDLDARWSELMRLVVAPLLDGLEQLTRRLQGAPEQLDLDRAYEQALDALAGTATPPPTEPAAAQPPAAPPLPAEPGGALGQLCARIRALELGEGREDDLLLDARILGVELEKQSPDPERLAELLLELTAADPGLLAPALASLLASREGDPLLARQAFQEAPTRRLDADKPRPAPRTTRRAPAREVVDQDAPTRRKLTGRKKKKS